MRPRTPLVKGKYLANIRVSVDMGQSCRLRLAVLVVFAGAFGLATLRTNRLLEAIDSVAWRRPFVGVEKTSTARYPFCFEEL